MARRNRDADPSSSLRNVRNAPGVPKGAKRHMRLAVIGLGRMGANISLRLMRAGHDIVGFDRNPDTVLSLIEQHPNAVSERYSVASNGTNVMGMSQPA